MNGIIPAGGFLGICPALDADEFDDDEISNARKAGLKSYIITARMTTVSSVRRQ
jgi:hypothetical protein